MVKPTLPLPMKLCTDCRHYGPPSHICSRPLSDRRSPVDGRLDDRLGAYADDERRGHRTWFTGRRKCGPDALFFDRVRPSSYGPPVRSRDD